MNNFPRYESYKDSGVEWLGDIPEYWKVKKLKFLGKIFPGLNGKKGDDFSKEYSDGMKPFIPFTNICNNEVISNEQFQYVKVREAENQHRIRNKDILFLMSSETLEEIAKCSIYVGYNEELYLNSFCKGLRVNSPNLYPKYLNYLLSSLSYRNHFSLYGRGFTRINIKQEYINEVLTLLPSITEQIAIIEFLDRKTAQTDKAIAQKQRLIELLEERQQILIYNAVTRGLNPKVTMKYSGVDWIGEIPEHWQVVSNYALFDERNDAGREGLPILMVSIHTAVSSDEISDEENIRGKVRIEDKTSYKYVKPNDIVFNMMRAWQGAIGAVSNEGMVSPAYIVAKPKRDLSPTYLEYQFRTKDYIQQMDRFSKGITDFRKRLYWNEFKRLKTILPPIEEQHNISEFITNLNAKVEKAVAAKRKEIEKLKEYKIVLINSAVTGKIKVGN